MNDIDDLMSRIEEINAKSPTELSAIDIDMLIAYHRKARERKASGEKATRPQSRGNVAEFLDKIIKVDAPTIRRRV